ncbi:arylsulfotransferase family protein [Candidatus Eisenbacteria bacterium]|uniref:Arylsulfotransferase family protein n=1 Tax=Eiseniibacteriota bacterium TaxID=2212470 RepID=A0ABV6YP84_UNCEI
MNKRAILAIAFVLIAVLLLIVVGTRIPRDRKDGNGDTTDARDRLKALRSLPYTMLSSETVDSTRSGVVIHHPEETWPGYNLYATGISGGVILMDMEGQTVHRWQDPREKPGPALLPRLLAGGDVLIIQKFSGLIRLDWNSNVVWHRTMIPHHDISFLPDSTFYVLDSEVKRYRGLTVKFPIIVHMNLDNEVLDRWPASENLDDIAENLDTRSFLDTILDNLLAQYGSSEGRKRLPRELLDEDQDASRTVHDYFHANTLSVIGDNPLGERDQRFKPGNILTCFRNVNQVLILEEETKRVVWSWGEGELEWPHHPSMLENGNILIFDNGIERQYSRLVELNPVTGEIEWEYVADPPESFFSNTRGSCQRLPNGNTLVCESNNGRFFEITRDGKIVWEWLNPAIKEGRRELLYRIERLSPSTIEPLLDQ